MTDYSPPAYRETCGSCDAEVELSTDLDPNVARLLVAGFRVDHSHRHGDRDDRRNWLGEHLR